MSNKADRQLDDLFRAARAEMREHAGASAQIARAELGFETRLMARLSEERGGSVFAWAWRLAPFFAALALAAGLWSRTSAVQVGRDAGILAEAARAGEERLLIASMTGERR